MSTVIYEFTAYAEGVEEWSTTPGEMVDGVETDYASTTTDGDIQKLTGNECVGTDLGTISKVELRPYAYADADDQLILRPVFGGTLDGDNHVIVPGVTPAFKAWQDILYDTNSLATLYESYVTGDAISALIYDDYWVAQTFTPSTGHDIGFVRLKLLRIASPGTLTVSIKATDGGGLPTGADLTSGTLNGNEITTDSGGEWCAVELTPYTLSSSTKYAIVVAALSGDAFNQIRWRSDNIAPTYTGGARCDSDDGGSSWAEDTGHDLMFEEGEGWWAWSDIQALDCDVEQNDVSKGNTMYCGMVQIQVTYTAAGGETYNRSCTRTGSVSISLGRVAVLGRSPSRVGSLSLSLAREVTLARGLTRTGSVSLSAAFVKLIIRAAARTGSVNTSLARVLTALRGMTRTGTVATSPAKAATRPRAVSRAGSVSVSVARVAIVGRAPSRVGSVSTSLARGVTLLRSVSRTGAVSTSAARAGTFLRGLLRTGSIAVSVVAEVGIIRAVTRTGAVSTSVDAIMSIGRQVTRVGSVATSLARNGVFARGLTRTGSVATSAARQVISGAEEFFVGMYRRIVG